MKVALRAPVAGPDLDEMPGILRRRGVLRLAVFILLLALIAFVVPAVHAEGDAPPEQPPAGETGSSSCETDPAQDCAETPAEPAECAEGTDCGEETPAGEGDPADGAEGAAPENPSEEPAPADGEADLLDLVDPQYCPDGSVPGDEDSEGNPICAESRSSLQDAVNDAVAAGAPGTIYLEKDGPFTVDVVITDIDFALTISGGWDFDSNTYTEGDITTLNGAISIVDSLGLITFEHIIFGDLAVITVDDSNIEIIGTAGDDEIQLILAGIGSSMVVVDGNGGNDSISIAGTDYADLFTLGMDSIALDGKTVTFTDVEALILDGGVGDDSLAVLGTDGDDLFTLTNDSIDLGDCDVLFSGIETIYVNGATGDDNVTLDVAGALVTYSLMPITTVSFSGLEFEFTGVETIEVENVDLVVSVSAISSLKDIFSSLPTLAANLATYEPLITGIPGIASNGDKSRLFRDTIGGVLQPGLVLSNALLHVNSYLNTSGPTLAELRSRLAGMLAGTSLQILGDCATGCQDRLLLDISYIASKTINTYLYLQDVPALAQEGFNVLIPGTSANSRRLLPLTTRMSLAFSVGIDNLTASPTGFIDLDRWQFEVSADLDHYPVDLLYGFVLLTTRDEHITFHLYQTVDVSLVDDPTPLDGYFSASDFKNIVYSVDPLMLRDHIEFMVGGDGMTIEIPLTVIYLIPGLSVLEPAVVFEDENILDPYDPELDLTSFEDLQYFGNINASSVYNLLTNFADWLGSLSVAEAFQVPIPFAQAAMLMAALDFSGAFQSTLIENLVVPLRNPDGSPREDGGSLLFGDAKTLFDRIDAALDDSAADSTTCPFDPPLASPASYSYDAINKELTYAIAFCFLLDPIDAPLDLSYSIAPFSGLTATTDVKVDVSGAVGFDLVLGFDLTANVAPVINPDVLTKPTIVSGILPISLVYPDSDDGVITVSDIGQLDDDVTFTLTAVYHDEHEVPGIITIVAIDTENNHSVADLVADINVAFGVAGFNTGTDLHAVVINDSDLMFKIVALDPAIASLEITSGTNLQLLGLNDPSSSFKMPEPTPLLLGTTPGFSTTFELALDSMVYPITVTVEPNADIDGFIQAVNSGLGDAGLSSRVEALNIFDDRDESDTCPSGVYGTTYYTDPVSGELVFFEDGVTPVRLNTLNCFGDRLYLAGRSESVIADKVIKIVTGDENLNLLGLTIGSYGRARSDAFFLDASSLQAQVSVDLQDLSGFDASMQLGYLGLDIQDAAITADLDLTIDLHAPDGGAEVPLSALTTYSKSICDPEDPEDLYCIAGVVTVTHLASAEATFPVVPLPEDDDFGIMDTLVTLTFTDWFTKPVDGDAEDTLTIPVPVELEPGLALENVAFADLIALFDHTAEYLRSIETDAAYNLAVPLPLIGKRVNQLVGYADEFAYLVDLLRDTPVNTIQAFRDLLRNNIDSYLPEGSELGEINVRLVGTDVVIELEHSYSQTSAQPLMLDLAIVHDGSIDELVGVNRLFTIDAGGYLRVEAGAIFNLAFGLETGLEPCPFIDDSTTLIYHIIAEAQGMEFLARMGPIGVHVIDGEAVLNESGATDDPEPAIFAFSIETGEGSGHHYFDEQLLDDTVEEIVGAMHLELPMYYPTPDMKYGPDLTIEIADLGLFLAGNLTTVEIVTPNLGRNGGVLSEAPSLLYQLLDPFNILDGLDLAFQVIQNAINTQIFSIDLPGIGDALESMAQWVNQLRTDLMEYLEGVIRTTANLEDITMSGAIEVILGAFVSVLGTRLRQWDNTELGGIEDIQVISDADDCEGSATYCQFNMHLHDEFDITVNGLSTGLPNLGLTFTTATINLTYAWDWYFGFGVDQEDGVYIVTSMPGHEENEITLDLHGVIDSDDDPSAKIAGRVQFLPFYAKDGTCFNGDDLTGNGAGVAAEPCPDGYTYETTDLEYAITVDLTDPDGDGRLSLAEIADPGTEPSQIITATLNGHVHIHLLMRTSFAESTLFPGIGLDFNEVWEFNDVVLNPFMMRTGTADDGLNPLFADLPMVEYANVKVFLGSFLTDYVKPVLDAIHDVLRPFDWLIHPQTGFLFMVDPVMSFLTGQTWRIIDELEVLFTGVKAMRPFLDAVAYIYGLTDMLQPILNNPDIDDIYIPIGAVRFSEYTGVTLGGLIDDAKDAISGFFGDRISLDGQIMDVGSPSIFRLYNLTQSLQHCSYEEGGPYSDTKGIDPRTGKCTNGKPGSTRIKPTAGLQGSFTLDFPIITDPNTILDLLAGGDADLVVVDLPTFFVSVMIEQRWIVYPTPPVYVRVAGTFTAQIDLDFGYDTRGIRLFMITGLEEDLADGFYVQVRDPDTGERKAQFTLSARIDFGAGVTFVVLDIYVGGGIIGTGYFYLHDVDGDGKVRWKEIAEVYEANHGWIFDVRVKIELFILIKVELNLFIVDITLVKFQVNITVYDETFDIVLPPRLGTTVPTQGGYILYLNMGPYAGNRQGTNNEIGPPVDSNEEFHVWCEGTCTSSSSDLRIEARITGTSTFYEDDRTTAYRNIVKVIAFGGTGNDIIDTSSLRIPVELHGGDDNDILSASSHGSSVLYGNDGSDELYAGRQDTTEECHCTPTMFAWAGTTIYGGAGDDLIYGGTGSDTLYGGSGNDEIYGFGGPDTLIGGAGNDILAGGTGDDTYIFNIYGGNDTVDEYQLLCESETDPFDCGGMDTLDFSLVFGEMTGLIDDQPADPAYPAFFIGRGFTVRSTLHFERILGGRGTDTFTLKDCGPGGLHLDGQNGSDTYYIHVGPFLQYPVTIIDTGEPWYTDRLFVIGTAAADVVGLTNIDAGDWPPEFITKPSRYPVSDDYYIMYFGPNETEPLVPLYLVYEMIDADDPYMSGTGLEMTTVEARAGEDEINVYSIPGSQQISLFGQADADVINIGVAVAADGSIDTAAEGTVDGQATLNEIFGGLLWGALIVRGDGAYDVLNVYDTADQGDNAGLMVSPDPDTEWITGLGMAQGIDYWSVERVNIQLGSGADTLDIQSTYFEAVTFVHAGPGDDTVLLSLQAIPENPEEDPLDAPIIVYGEAGNDTIDAYGSALGMLLDGGPGEDVLRGGLGADVLVGNAGHDVMLDGRAGNDRIWGDSRLDVAALPNMGSSFFHNDLDVEVARLIEGAGDDTLAGNLGDDLLFGEQGNDVIAGNEGFDILFGDFGSLDGETATRAFTEYWNGVQFRYYLVVMDTDPFDLAAFQIFTVDPELHVEHQVLFVQTASASEGGDDRISGGGEQDLIFGGVGDDWLWGDDFVIRPDGTPVDVVASNNGILGEQRTPGGSQVPDLLIGDNARVEFDGAGISNILTGDTDNATGGVDTLFGSGGDDILIGGVDADRLDGDAGDDLIFGDSVGLVHKADPTNPRFRALQGTLIYAADGSPLVSLDYQYADPVHISAWAYLEIVLQDPYYPAASFGDDYIAGGPGNDQIFAQRGDDTVQGDGSINSLVNDDVPVTACRDLDGGLIVQPSFDASTDDDDFDNDDYIEGNAGSDVIFGNLGRDDLIGGSSSLFSLTDPLWRPDDADLIFGGSGTRIDRNTFVGSQFGEIDDDPAIGLADRHARDADIIVGDNANIYRLVGTMGAGSDAYLTFNYDTYTSALRIIPRVVALLDYTPGGPDYDAIGASSDIGAGDELHGESGDDALYGMTGDDVLFGESEDDDLIGGWGHDWISGGTGDDGALGDDGRIYTSRNGIAEPLYGLADLVDQLDAFISTPGKVQQAVINVAGQLKKAVNLEPFNLDPAATQDPLFDPLFADDILYGGLGNDFLHGGAGDDAISGAEALPAYYANPWNPGDILGYGHFQAGEFAAYNENDPWSMIAGFLLNFDAQEGPSAGSHGPLEAFTDGDDVLFGDLGNDWLVGGTGRDHLYGGYGDDLLNADDDLGTDGGANTSPDTHPSYEDIAYGGAGRDILIGNTGGDRLIDWAGEFNSYVVPFAPFGVATVSRTLQPQLMDYLYALSASDGADPTRAEDLQVNWDRNGEPYGELGLVAQKDPDWNDQTGGPADPQPGNTGGVKRDVLRSATPADRSLTMMDPVPAVPVIAEAESGKASDAGKKKS